MEHKVLINSVFGDTTAGNRLFVVLYIDWDDPADMDVELWAAPSEDRLAEMVMNWLDMSDDVFDQEWGHSMTHKLVGKI